LGVESRTDVNKSVNSFYPEAAAMGRVVSPAKKLQLGLPELRNIEAELRKCVQRYRHPNYRMDLQLAQQKPRMRPS
jgi:hypothetical protein